MEKKLRTYLYIIIGIVFITQLCACYPMKGYYETAAPNRESLLFINDSICIHNRCLIGYEENLSIYHDTCHYYIDKEKRIILYKKHGVQVSVSATINNELNRMNLNFLYDIIPQVYNIPRDSFTKRQDFVFPIYYQPMSYPTSYQYPTFYEMYGMEHPITYDTLIMKGTFLIWLRHPVFTILYPSNSKGACFQSRPNHRKDNQSMYRWLTSTYEYLNYYTNIQKKDSISSANLYHRVFSYSIDSSNKEQLVFFNDSLCVHSVLYKKFPSLDVCMSDTFVYSIHNHIITLNNSNILSQCTTDARYFIHNMNGDALAYENGILFYSKVYKTQQDGQEKKSLIVKPFIDESMSLFNKTDSINAIMKAYFNVYVPLNFYTK